MTVPGAASSRAASGSGQTAVNMLQLVNAMFVAMTLTINGKGDESLDEKFDIMLEIVD